MKSEITISPKEKTSKEIEFWEREYKNNNSICFTLECKKNIEENVLNWLKRDEADSVFQVDLFDHSGKHVDFMLWSRSEIYIKECVNEWCVWRIATCCSYDKMISYKVKTVGTNHLSPDLKLVNEVRSQDYSKLEQQLWGVISYDEK